MRELLEANDDIEVVGEAGTAEEGMARIPAVKPDVAVVDMRLPDGNGVEVCREVRSRDESIQCLILTSFADDEALFDSIMAGAAGYLLKQIKGTDLVDAIRRVAAGQSLLDPNVTARVLERLRKGPEEDERLARLTEQERKILDLIAEGLDEPPDRRADVPRREDGEELRVEPAVEARHGTAHRGRGVRREAGAEEQAGRITAIRDLGPWPRRRHRATLRVCVRRSIPGPGSRYSTATSASHCSRTARSGASPSSPDGRPLVFPVNFALDGDAIVFRTDAGTKLHGARRGQVAFECDGVDSTYHTGWSVLATGNAEEVVNAAEVARLARLPLGPWCPGPKSTWLRLRPRMLTGRRIPPHGQTRTEGELTMSLNVMVLESEHGGADEA